MSSNGEFTVRFSKNTFYGVWGTFWPPFEVQIVIWAAIMHISLPNEEKWRDEVTEKC